MSLSPFLALGPEVSWKQDEDHVHPHLAFDPLLSPTPGRQAHTSTMNDMKEKKKKQGGNN